MKNSIDKIYLYPGYVDLRKGMNNSGYLAAQIYNEDVYIDKSAKKQERVLLF